MPLVAAVIAKTARRARQQVYAGMSAHRADGSRTPLGGSTTPGRTTPQGIEQSFKTRKAFSKLLRESFGCGQTLRAYHEALHSFFAAARVPVHCFGHIYCCEGGIISHNDTSDPGDPSHIVHTTRAPPSALYHGYIHDYRGGGGGGGGGGGASIRIAGGVNWEDGPWNTCLPLRSPPELWLHPQPEPWKSILAQVVKYFQPSPSCSRWVLHLR